LGFSTPRLLGAFGGSGFSQEKCGQYLAERIASIWASTNHITIPNPLWKGVDEKWNEHKKNPNVAKALKITLRKKVTKHGGKKTRD
jgi:hypothetical protein